MLVMRAVFPYLGKRRRSKVMLVEELMGQKYDPRPCAECGGMFIAKPKAPLMQKYCSSNCCHRAKKRRYREKAAAAVGRMPGDRCGVTTQSGVACNNFPLVGSLRCRHHSG